MAVEPRGTIAPRTAMVGGNAAKTRDVVRH